MNNSIKEIETPYVRMCITKDDILYCEYKQGITLDKDSVIEAINDRLQFQNDIEYTSIFDPSGLSYISPEAKKILNKDGFKGLTDCALVIKKKQIHTSYYLNIPCY